MYLCVVLIQHHFGPYIGLCQNMVLVSEPGVPNSSSQSATLARALNWDCEGVLGLSLPPIYSQTQPRRERERQQAALRRVIKILHDPKWSCRIFVIDSILHRRMRLQSLFIMQRLGLRVKLDSRSKRNFPTVHATKANPNTVEPHALNAPTSSHGSLATQPQTPKSKP